MTKKIAIIGAGIAGLTIGKNLHSLGFEVNIFDKGRGVGGRMSSRRTNWGYLDHGCQYFTAKGFSFANFIQEHGQTVKIWQGKFASWQDGNYTPIEVNTNKSPLNPPSPPAPNTGGAVMTALPLLERGEEYFRYVPIMAMNSLCKSIATSLDVKLQTRIVKLTKNKNQTWTLIDEEDQEYNGYDWLIVTAPPVQTHDLLVSHTAIAEEIAKIEMLPNFTLMLTLAEEMTFPWDGIQLQHPILGWIAVNNSKPSRGEKTSLVIQSNFNWATDNLENDRDMIMQQLKDSASEILQVSLENCLYRSLHLWRYAIPAQKNEAGCYLDAKNAIGVCGDWCIGGKVEAAFESANTLTELINKL